jgi:hypothetical protein
MITAAMPDFRLDIEDIFGAGDRATIRLRMSGTHTGRAAAKPARNWPPPVRQRGVHLPRYRGRLAEAWRSLTAWLSTASQA